MSTEIVAAPPDGVDVGIASIRAFCSDVSSSSVESGSGVIVQIGVGLLIEPRQRSDGRATPKLPSNDLSSGGIRLSDGCYVSGASYEALDSVVAAVAGSAWVGGVKSGC